ncbi:MAG: D-alanine--D-alanine ligase family protein [Parcubacteria group bacterium]|jgi:D-alanine-D-alanine ligase
MSQNLTIGVFFGSRNPEHDVSIITGQMIIAELKKLNYTVVPVYIDKDGTWFSHDDIGSLKFFTQKDFTDTLKNMPPCEILCNAKNNTLIIKTKSLFSKETVIDLAFPAFHGMNGEDGTIQGLFELSNVPYVGCDVASSAMTMDKIITKQLYKSAQIPTTAFTYFTQDDWDADRDHVLAQIKNLHWPVFIKPARLGSSIGIAKAHDDAELLNACEVALHYDTRIIVEESVENLMDITCAVLGNAQPVPSLVQESTFAGEHFSYEAKYLENGGAQLGNDQSSIVIPARIDKQTTKTVQDMAVEIYKLFGCSGIARVDFLYDKKNATLYANEINTMPGTLYHHLWKASGTDIHTLLQKLINLALDKHKKKNATTATFSSHLLDYAKSIKLQINQ